MIEFSNNNNSSEAMLHVTLTDGGQMPPWPVGLDGVYRPSPGEYNLPILILGTPRELANLFSGLGIRRYAKPAPNSKSWFLCFCRDAQSSRSCQFVLVLHGL
jgi:hypothetical protein